jgi:hypothetical protein
VTCLIRVAVSPSAALMVIACSASGARKEEQGEKAEEESAYCVERIPLNTLRSLNPQFDKSHDHYSMGICALPMRTYTYTCQDMSVVMLPRRKHDVRLRDKHACILP